MRINDVSGMYVYINILDINYAHLHAHDHTYMAIDSIYI